jgi:ParB/RepB/Spo0J family partition protein
MNVQNIPVAEIHADFPWNCRGQILYQNARELAESIAKDGLQQPIIVQPCRDVPGKKWKVVAGFTRFAACCQIPGRTHIACDVRGELTEAEARKINVVENLVRKNLNLKQEAGAVKELADLGQRPEEIAKELGQSKFWVDVRLRLLQLPEAIQDEAAAGLLTQENLLQISRLKTQEKQFSAVAWIKEQRQKGEKKRLDAINRGRGRRPKRMKQLERLKGMIAFHLGDGCLAWKVAAWALGHLSDATIEGAIEREAQAISA